MKHLSATNIVGETGADKFVSTPISTALTVPKFRDGISYLYVSPVGLLLLVLSHLVKLQCCWTFISLHPCLPEGDRLWKSGKYS